MGNEITVLTKEELEKNPSIIGENLARLAVAIEDNRDDIESIKYRGFWKKLTTNNTRDLAWIYNWQYWSSLGINHFFDLVFLMFYLLKLKSSRYPLYRMPKNLIS